MFQFQLKCGMYGKLIKKNLDMMDYGMKKWLERFEGKGIGADFNINLLENLWF